MAAKQNLQSAILHCGPGSVIVAGEIYQFLYHFFGDKPKRLVQPRCVC